MRACLVVVDLQEDFLPSEGSLAVTDGRLIIPLINNLLVDKDLPWSAIVATQDWHGKDHTSFASNHGVEPFSQLEFKHPLNELDKTTNEVITKIQTVWPDHCVQNTIGANIDAGFIGNFNSISPDIPKTVVQKGYLSDREYYLCFQDTWGIHHTEMEKFLRDNKITHVVFVGLAYDYCVYNSAKDCAALGFKTFVIKNCSKSVSPQDINKTDELYRKANVQILATPDDLVPIFNEK